MYVKELSSYNDYYDYQNARSGLGNNENRIFDDLYMLKDVGLDLNEYKDTNFNILDIGCRAAAHIVVEFHNRGYKNTYGMDIGSEAESNWSNNLKMLRDFLKKGDIHDGNPFDFKFDMISMSHVLEHLYDPKKAIGVIHDSLSDNGIVYVIIPFQSKDELYNHHPHYVSFENEEEHIKFWEDNGFKVLMHKVVDGNPDQVIPGESRMWIQRKG
jgi:SAM-dependent methyltransferase